MKIEIHAWPYNDINFPQYCLFLSYFQPVTEVYFPFRKKINMLNQKQAENDKTNRGEKKMGKGKKM